MTLQDVLDRVPDKRGMRRLADGSYKVICPAHDDKEPSLTIAEKDGKILVCCHGGCPNERVLQAMGLSMRDLFNDDKPRQKGATPRKLVKVYPYMDEDGKILYEVCRYEAKDFRQRRKDPGHAKADRNGYVWSLSGVRQVVYRLPAVKKAIEAGQPVYLVEGEKDADNMARLGFCATTNAGGAKNWRDVHTEYLRGADVVIIPDNDDAGREGRRAALDGLLKACRSVRMCDLRAICPELKEKGDVSDLLEMWGPDRTRAQIDAMVAQCVPISAAVEAAPWDLAAQAAPEAEKSDEELTPRERAEKLINALPGFCVHEGCICQEAEGTPKKLCTFSAVTSGIVARDDGVNVEKLMLIDGWTSGGTQLPPVKVSAKNYRRMDWLTEAWDIQANIMPGTTALDKVRYIISEAGSATATRTTEYTHTGWRKIGGKWMYLHHGGVIGGEGVQVDVGTALSGYCMDSGYSPKNEAKDMEDCTLITEIIPRRISVPMVAFAFLAPLRDALLRAGYPPAFTTYLVGGSGGRKSTLAALVLSYFGQFTALSLPSSFNDTANYIRKKAFYLKDALLVIDDYHPSSSVQGRKKMEDTAASLARAFGDLAQRGRMNADSSITDSMPPRALGLITGEDMPSVVESDLARYYSINVEKGDVPGDSTMTFMQELAASGAMAHLMRRYIEWLAPQMDELPEKLDKRFVELREKAQGLKLGHSRAPGTVAHLMIGYEYYIRFITETGILGDVDSAKIVAAEIDRAMRDIVTNSRKQGEESREDRPSALYVASIREMLITHKASVMDLREGGNKSPEPGCIGYCDQQYYYLLPEASYVMVCDAYTHKGMAFPLSQRMLHKQMRDDGMLIPDENGARTARGKSINGKVVRLLWLPRETVDGRKEDVQLDFIETHEKTPFDE